MKKWEEEWDGNYLLILLLTLIHVLEFGIETG